MQIKNGEKYALSVEGGGVLCCSQLDGEGGDDEASERDIVLVRLGADETFVGFGRMAFCQFCVLRILRLPIGKALRVGHLKFALL